MLADRLFQQRRLNDGEILAMSIVDLDLPPMDHEHTIPSTGFDVGISMKPARRRESGARPSAFSSHPNEYSDFSSSSVDFLPPCTIVSA